MLKAGKAPVVVVVVVVAAARPLQAARMLRWRHARCGCVAGGACAGVLPETAKVRLREAAKAWPTAVLQLSLVPTSRRKRVPPRCCVFSLGHVCAR